MALRRMDGARKIWPILVGLARTQSAPKITYGDLGQKIGKPGIAMRHYLGVIQEYCKNHRLPTLQSMVVTKGQGVPGRGYDGSGSDKKSVSREIEKVVKYGKWDPKAPF